MFWVVYVSIVGAALVALSAVVHVHRWTWTGFTGKTLWDSDLGQHLVPARL